MSFEALAGEFASEALALLDQVEQALLAVERATSEDERSGLALAARRALHTLKGNAGFLGAETLQEAFHKMEDAALALKAERPDCSGLLAALDSVRREVARIGAGGGIAAAGEEIARIARGITALERGPTSIPTIPTSPAAAASPAFSPDNDLRVPQSRLDQLVAAAGELLVQNSRLQALASGRATSDAQRRTMLAEVADGLDRSLKRLHELVLRVRTTPVDHVVPRLQRVVRDEAHAFGKRVELVQRGEAVEVDKAVLDQLAGALGHLVRNSVVHGIEAPGDRAAAGKPACGTIALTARALGNRVELAVEDDGRGLDRAAIRRRAAELGRDPSIPAEELVFEAGFSTATLSRAAGRGVGLDAVRRTVLGLGGTLALESNAGGGTRFVLTVPLSLALQRAVLCRIAGEVYALPASSVLHARRVDDTQVRWLGHGRALEHDGALVPLIDAEALLGTRAERGELALFVQAGPVAALRVDQLLGQQDFVFQPLEPMVLGRAPASAAAMLGDGRLVLRLEPERLVASALRGERLPSNAEVRP